MQINKINPPIWAPRWHDRKVLIAKYKVASNAVYQEITFKTKSLPHRYRILTSIVTSSPLTSNGRIPCYQVPLEDLIPITEDDE